MIISEFDPAHGHKLFHRSRPWGHDGSLLAWRNKFWLWPWAAWSKAKRYCYSDQWQRPLYFKHNRVFIFGFDTKLLSTKSTSYVMPKSKWHTHNVCMIIQLVLKSMEQQIISVGCMCGSLSTTLFTSRIPCNKLLWSLVHLYFMSAYLSGQYEYSVMQGHFILLTEETD